MMQTRYEIASLLGYSSWADYNAADKMIVKGDGIAGFIEKIDTAARPVAEKEFAMLLDEKKRSDPSAHDLADYEISYLSEQVRRAKFDFDSQSVRPYLPYPKVKQGILDTAATLFQLSFRQEKNVPAWDPAVETWDVIDRGKVIGRFYLDMHASAAGQIQSCRRWRRYSMEFAANNFRKRFLCAICRRLRGAIQV